MPEPTRWRKRPVGFHIDHDALAHNHYDFMPRYPRGDRR